MTSTHAQKAMFTNILFLFVTACPAAPTCVEMSSFQEKMVQVRADMDPGMRTLMNGDMSPGLTENQKRALALGGNEITTRLKVNV